MKWITGLFKKKREQRTFCYCPDCRNELCSSGSFVKDTDYVYYKCTKCGCETKWDFDRWMIPVIVGDDGLPLSINFESTESTKQSEAET